MKSKLRRNDICLFPYYLSSKQHTLLPRGTPEFLEEVEELFRKCKEREKKNGS